MTTKKYRTTVSVCATCEGNDIPTSLDFTQPALTHHMVVRLLAHVHRQFLLFDVLNMEIVYEGRDSRSWIRACCFSPDGKSFALASTDNKIYLYDATSYALRAKVSQAV